MKNKLKTTKTKNKLYIVLLSFGLHFAINSSNKAEPVNTNNSSIKSIWDDFDINDPNLNSQKSNLQNNSQNNLITASQKNNNSQNNNLQNNNLQNNNSQKIYENLNQVKEQIKTENDSFFSGKQEPIGTNLDNKLPLDRPLTERFANDILDPIELDVNSADILDLSLEKALLIGLDSNLPLRIVDETVIRDKWRFWGTTSQLLPNVFANYNLRDISTVGSRNQTQLGLSYSFAPSQIFSTIASYYDWMAGSQLQGVAVQDSIKQIANQYYDVLRARGELAVRIEAVEQAKIQLNLNEKLEEAGVGTRFAVLQSKEQLAENELALIAQQSNARIAEVQLLNTLNMPLGTDLRLEESQIFKKTLISPAYNMNDLVDFAMSNRPDITRREFAYKASKRRIAESVALAITPRLTARALTERNATYFPDSLKLFDSKALGLGEIGLQMPILTGLGLGQIAPINERRALARQANLELSNQILTVETEVRDSFLRSNAAEKQITVAERQLEAATEAIKLARIRLQNGVGTNIDLIDTQRNYVNALVNKVRAIIQYNQAQVDQLRSIGLISLSGILDQDMAYSNNSNNSLDLDEESENSDLEFEQTDYLTD